MTKGQGTSVGDGSGQTVVVVNQTPTHYSVPPSPPPPSRIKLRRGAYTHDGFYLRGGWDFGAMVLTNSASSSSYARLVSFAYGVNCGFGWTLGKGVVIGGRLDLGGIPRPMLLSNGESYALDGSFTSVAFQLFADWYVLPKKGFHVETEVGPGSLRYHPHYAEETRDYLNDDAQNANESINGVTGILGAGYEWWVATQWSIGLLFHLNWGVYAGRVGDSASMATIEQQDGKGSLTMFTPMFGFTVTCH